PRCLPVQTHCGGNRVAVAGVHRRIEIQVGLAEGAIGRIADAAGRVSSRASPIIQVVPADGLNVHLTIPGWKDPAGDAAPACPGRSVILRVAAEAAEISQVDRAIIKGRRSATISALVDGTSDRSGKVSA